MTKHFGILLFQKGMLTVKTSQAYFMPAFYQFLKRQLIPLRIALGYCTNIFCYRFYELST